MSLTAKQVEKLLLGNHKFEHLNFSMLLKRKKIDAFAGPITFGEITYQLVNQTLVYVTVA
jgi:hypothetical protein